MHRRKILAVTMTLLTILVVLQVLPFRVEGASTGTVCIAQITDTSCPASPPVFNGPLTTPNTLLRVPVMINNTAPFLGFDITVNSSDVSKLRPYGADLIGSIMPAGSITLAECIGGVLKAGSSCSPTDNPTTVHLAVVGPFGFLAPPGTTGLLFTAIFSITGTTVPGGVVIRYQNGCSSSSSRTMCVIVSNGTVSPVPEATQTGGFDNSDTTTLPYATLTTTTGILGQSLAGAPAHALPTVIFSATSQNGFNATGTATLNLAASFNGTGTRPQILLSTPLIDLTGTPAQTFTQTGSVSSTVPAGVYISTVTATFQSQDAITFTTSSLVATLSLPLSVTDFAVSVSPNAVAILPLGSRLVTVSISPKSGFDNLVKLGITIPVAAASAGVGATYSISTISGSGISSLNVTTGSSTSSGTYVLMVTSNSTLNGFTRTHTVPLTLTVGLPSFQITANPSALVLAPGNTGKLTVTVAAVNGFAGVVSLSLTITPSSGFTCNLTPTIIALNFTASGTSSLSCNGSAGTYSVVITASGSGQSHSATVSVVVQANGQRTVVAVDPSATIDLARASKTITIAVNITNSPPINAVSIMLTYDFRVLQVSSLNYSTNVLTQTSYPTVLVRDCLDGHGAGGNSALCGTDDGPGVTSFAMAILGGTTVNNTSGSLFKLTFNVNTTAPAFSQIQIKQATVALGSSAISFTSFDGYYTSLSCGGTPCTPPKTDFKWSPLNPTTSQVVTFYGNASRPSTGASIVDYFWTFGDTASPLPYRDTGTNSTAAYLYQFAGNYSVTLRVTDSNGLISSRTLRVKVIPPKPSNDFTLSGPDRVAINPGQQITLSDSILIRSSNLTSNLALSAISPQGLTVSISPSVLTLTPNALMFSSLTITASFAIAPGNYMLTIIATAGAISHNATAIVVVLAPNFFVQVDMNAVTIGSGSSATISVALFTGNLNTTIYLSSPDTIGSPSPNHAFNISFSPASIAIYPGVQSFLSSMIIRPYAGTTPGTYTILVVGTNGSLTRYTVVIVTVIGPPDFTIQTFPSNTQVIAGSTGSLNVNVQRSPCCSVLPPFNVTLSVAVSPLVANGPRVSLRDNFVTVYGSSYTYVTILTGPSTPPGNYTIIVAGISGSFVHTAISTLIVFPPPALKATPPTGPVGTKVQVTGSGFIPLQPYPQTHVLWVTFDDQFLGEEVTSSSSFTFTFNVPDAQAGFHLVKVLDFYTGVNATTPFQVLATPSGLSVTIDTGSIYFPGDSAAIYVLVSQNGTLAQSLNLQLHLTLIRPDGSNITLSVQRVSLGLFKATYLIPASGPIGTYSILATAQGPNSVQGVALRSFEVKPSWLSSNGRNLASASVAVGAIGMIGFAWKKGYFKRKQDDEVPSHEIP